LWIGTTLVIQVYPFDLYIIRTRLNLEGVAVYGVYRVVGEVSFLGLWVDGHGRMLYMALLMILSITYKRA
jgi:hypothetical protein